MSRTLDALDLLGAVVIGVVIILLLVSLFSYLRGVSIGLKDDGGPE